MDLWANGGPHRGSIYTSASGRDAGGGVTLTHTLSQSSVPCLINTMDGSERELFAQQGMIVSHRVGIRSDLLSTPVKRGDQFRPDDTGVVYIVQGIAAGRAYDELGFPAFTYLMCQEQL